MDFCQIMAIDVGTRNFAWCVVCNNHWRKPLHWQHEDLWAPQPNRRRAPTKTDIVRITVDWVRRRKHILDECDCIVLENQMRTPFIVMNTVIQSLYFNIVSIIHPMTVGTFWSLPKQREHKKTRGVQVTLAHTRNIPAAGKEDDLADAWLMAVYEMIQRQAIGKGELSLG